MVDEVNLIAAVDLATGIIIFILCAVVMRYYISNLIVDCRDCKCSWRECLKLRHRARTIESRDLELNAYPKATRERDGKLAGRNW